MAKKLGVVGSVAVAVAMVGCGGSDSESVAGATTVVVAESASSEAPVVAAPADATSPPTEPAPTSPPTEPPTTLPPSTVPPQPSTTTCMTANWIVSSDETEDVFTDTAIASTGMTIDVEGQGILGLRGDGTYTYTPAFTALISFLDTEATGQWSGTQEGTWTVEGDVLTMATTASGVTGSVNLAGAEMALPPIRGFEGVGRVVKCDVATLDIELTTSIGVLVHRLIIGE